MTKDHTVSQDDSGLGKEGLSPSVARSDARGVRSSVEGNGFTPGPWVVSGTGVWAASPWGARVRLAEVSVHSPMNGMDWLANARLIAAAPDLLEALKRAAEGWANAIELGLIPRQHVGSATILRDEARAASAKATSDPSPTSAELGATGIDQGREEPK